MTFFEHLEELRKRLRIVVYTVLAAFVVIMTFSFQPVAFSETAVYLPLPTLRQNETIPAQFIVLVSDWLVPENVTLVVLTPWEAFLVFVKAGFFLAAVVTSPVITYEFWKFIAPALKKKERRLIVRVSVPVVLLFLAGVLVSFLVVLPFTFPFLYGFAIGVRAEPFLRLDDFVDFVLLFSLAFGAAFELPVIMYGLSSLGLVNSEFWRRNWRLAVVGIFLFGAIITPDGSGITMLLVAIPMLFLYVGGYLAIRRRERRLARAKSS